MLNQFANQHVLLLQGPMGPFFRRLRDDLEQVGARVSKINLCGGDALFYPTGAIAFSGKLEEWPNFLVRFVTSERVSTIILFGDCRPYHQVIREVVELLHVDMYVLEEGYLRPDFITIERGGVNSYSPLPRHPAFYRTFVPPKEEPPHRATRNAFRRAAWYASLYSWANFLGRPWFPHYRHHRPLHPIHQGYLWLASGLKKLWRGFRESGKLALFTGKLSGRYFLVPLQVHNDAQITTHSKFKSIEQFATTVVESFARNAPADAVLVFKHHPLDRAYRDYSRFMRKLSERFQLQERLHYVHDLHLPTLFQHARGTIVVNSTTGLSSIHHGTPVITLGEAIYDMPGLTCQEPLDDFWTDPGRIDRDLYRRFRAWLLHNNQANGNFYRPIPEAGNSAGVFWPTPEPQRPVVAPATQSSEPTSIEERLRKVAS